MNYRYFHLLLQSVSLCFVVLQNVGLDHVFGAVMLCTLVFRLCVLTFPSNK